MKLCKSCGVPQESSGLCNGCAVSSRKCEGCSSPCLLKWCFQCHAEYHQSRNPPKASARSKITDCYSCGQTTTSGNYCKKCYNNSKCKTCGNRCDNAYEECKTCFEKHPICGCGKRILHDKGGNFCTPCFKQRPFCSCGRKILHDKGGAWCTPCFKASRQKPRCYTHGCLGRGEQDVKEGNEQVTVCTGCYNEYYA
jgi:hypothetical protein